MSTRTDTADLLRQAADRGWRVSLTANSHYRLRCRHACRCQIIAAGTPSDHRHLDNLRAYLARCTGWSTR